MYKYDTHMHTAIASSCATITPEEIALEYKDAGYTGIIVTDHFFRGNTTVPFDLSWRDRIDMFCSGYEQVKKIGNRIGLDVFFGWEETFDGTDFLVYGLDKEFMINHPEMEFWTIKDQYEAVSKEGGLVVHAHPYRNRNYIDTIRLCPKTCDAIEVFNGSNFDEENRDAYAYAKEYNLKTTGGSDNHHSPIIPSGIITTKRLNTIEDYVELIKKGTGYKIIYS